MTEELALRDLVSRYADAVTRMDAAAVADLFAADGEWIVTGHGEPRGREEIKTFLAGLLENWTVIVHGLLSGVIDLDPVHTDRATGRWSITEFGQLTNGDEVFFAGAYVDAYVRADGVWRFARREYHSMFRRVGGNLSPSPSPPGSGSADA